MKINILLTTRELTYGELPKMKAKNVKKESTICKFVWVKLNEFNNLIIGRQKCTIVTHGQGGMLGWHFLNQVNRIPFWKNLESYMTS